MKLTRDRDDFGKLVEKLEAAPDKIRHSGRHWVERSTIHMNSAFRQNLATQGRGGIGPPLTDFTKRVYGIVGEPDGSGIRNHIVVLIDTMGNTFTGVVGIPAGRPTIITKIQNDGAIIPITNSMRDYFASIGMPLSQSKHYFDVPGRRAWSDAQSKSYDKSQRMIRHFNGFVWQNKPLIDIFDMI